MNMFSREWIEGLAFIGIHSAATGYVVGNIARTVKSPIAKVFAIGAAAAANAYTGYRLGEFIKGYSLNKNHTNTIHVVTVNL